MYKKTIEYEDFNGNVRKEDFYFHLSEAELIEMEMGYQGGLTQMVNKIVSTQDHEQIISIFKMLLLKSYGEKSPDGRRFIKSEELAIDFSHTNAYSKLFIELATDSDEAAKFVNSVIPKDLKTEDPKKPMDFQKKREAQVAIQQITSDGDD